MISKRIFIKILSFGLAGLYFGIFTLSAMAQTGEIRNGRSLEMQDVDMLASAPRSTLGVSPSLTQTDDEEMESTSLIPPLPFTGPQVGPLVKRQLPDIETRTRALEPLPTDGSEPFEFPEDLGENEHWIRVNLTEQLVTAYEGTTPMRSFLVSTGVPGFNTVTGEFRVWLKVAEQVMSGGEPGTSGYYYLPEVKWVMYFYQEYALHGSYWHDNFGNPMSHGCVNMTNLDAKWLFDFAGPVWDGETVWYRSTAENPGARVIVHY
ncbi:MAG: L,D-transpeptidase [Chloroflexota bacterium]